jgi:hypothetical protein
MKKSERNKMLQRYTDLLNRIDTLQFILNNVEGYEEDDLHSIIGYTQCQEDMAAKKYTEEDMIDAIIYGSSLTTCNIKLYAHNYINSLKKRLI